MTHTDRKELGTKLAKFAVYLLTLKKKFDFFGAEYRWKNTEKKFHILKKLLPNFLMGLRKSKIVNLIN